MTNETLHLSAIEGLMAALPTPSDLLQLVAQTLKAADSQALRLLLAGVQLQREATKEVQRKGIRKAQTVVKKYPGRIPMAFGLSKAKCERLAVMLEGRLDASTFEDAPPKANISQMAKDLKCSRTTLYRYIKATPALLATLETLRRRQGQIARTDTQRAAKSARKAKKLFDEGMKSTGLSRKNRPTLEAVRNERKGKRDANSAHWAEERAKVKVKARELQDSLGKQFKSTSDERQ